MKKNTLFKITLIALFAVAVSSCTGRKKKKGCDTCPKWGYVSSGDYSNQA